MPRRCFPGRVARVTLSSRSGRSGCPRARGNRMAPRLARRREKHRQEAWTMHAAEFTLHAKPGHFDQVAEIYAEFAADFLSDHPALKTVLVLGDEASRSEERRVGKECA